MSWPLDPRPWADSPHPAAFLGALWSPDVPNRETSHDGFRSLDDIDRLHRAGVRWSTPIELSGARVRFRAGYRPRRWRLLWETPSGPVPLCDWGRADAEVIELPARGPGLGITVEQAPGGGSLAWPGVLRIEALSAAGPACPLDLRIARDGAERRPRLPLATDGSPHTHLDVSDGEWLALTTPWRAIPGVRLELIRLGEVTDAASLRAWLARPGPCLWVDERPVPCRRLLDLGAAGVVAGRAAVALVPRRPCWGRRLRIALPTPPHALALREISLAAGEGQPIATNPAGAARHPADGDARFEAAGEYSLEAARRYTTPVRQAISLGLPGADRRVGLLPGGTLVAELGLHAEALHIAMTVDGVPLGALGPWRRALEPGLPGVEQRVEHTAGEVRQTVAVLASPPALLVTTELPAPADVIIGLSPRAGFSEGPRLDSVDGLVSRDGQPVARVESNWRSEPADGEHRLHRHVTSTFTLRLPLGERGAAAPQRLDAQLPGEWQGLLEALWCQAGLFLQAGDRVAYGLFPSVYRGDVFGLEEDYLFRALAYWGAPARGLAAFRATYLTDAHLAPQHYLHDLRAGLTPWQLHHLLRLAGARFDTLPPEERARIEGLGQRIIAERARTRRADGSKTAGGWRVFPGLLPPFRYGGDLDFPTQSLYVNAASWCALRAIAAMTGRDLGAELADYRAAILAAFDAMRDGPRQPLHSGGEDPADYYQLMACGILDPLDFFAPGDPRAARIDAQVEDEGRLFFRLPRFDGWGDGQSIDAVYCHGYLLNALRAGRREVFWTGLLGHFAHGMDPEVFTFREVGPIQLGEADTGHWLPGRRLSRSEPCVGGLGVALQLLRHALITELPEADGGLGRRLRLCAGVPPGWWAEPFHVRGAPSLAGPVDLAWDPASGLAVRAPGAAAVEWVDRDGQVRSLAPEAWR